MNLPSEQESLYRTCHNSLPGYREWNWGIATLPQWIGFLKKPASILEIGCGNGKLCKVLAGMGYDVIGLDIVPGNYDRTGYKFVKHDITLGFLPFKDKEFDYCVSFDVIEHLPPKWIEHHIGDMFRVANEIVIAASCAERKPFHLTVQPPEWWVEKFNRICASAEMKTFHIYTDPCLSERLLFHGKRTSA